MSTAPVVVTRPSLPGRAVADLAARRDVRIWSGEGAPSADELADFAGGAVAMLAVAKDVIGEELLRRCPSLRAVAIASNGYDLVDVDAVRRHGVRVTHTPAVLSDAVADHAMFLMTGARRRAAEHMALFRSGGWDHHLALDELLGLDVHGSTMGLVGYGQVGKAIARRADGYDMDVVEYSRGPHDERARAVELDELLEISDIVVVCLPLFDSTRHIIGAEQLRRMKPTATLVNVGRGPTIDEAALVTALAERWIHSAGLDVFDREPIAATDHPLQRLPNAFITPHMASATESARASMVALAAADLDAMLDGREPRHLLTELRT